MVKYLLKKLRISSAKGQSLVEMAIITPLLIFFLIGIFEVGWALRNYLVLVNVNREITRFAIRPGYMNFSTLADLDTSYQRVRDWASSAVSEQLVLDFRDTGNLDDTGTTTLIVSHAVIDTGKPCENITDAGCSNCDDFINIPGHNPFPQDDLIVHPGLPSYDYQAATFGPPETKTGVRNTRINYDDLVTSLAARNNKFNCELIKKGGVPSANNVIITELFHDQPQLFGFPFISNPLTDPVPLYTHTTMRLIGAARSSGGVEGSITQDIDTIGPICLVYPMLVKDSDVGPTTKNIIEHGWLKWGNLISDDEEYVKNALLYPQMSLNDFAQAGGVQIGSQVNMVTLTNPDLDEQLEALVGQTIIIPTTGQDPPGDPVTISGFVWATISSYDLDNSPNTVMANFDTTTPLPAACVP